MTSLFSYLLTFFGIAFWFFRAIATLLYQLDVDFFATPINVNAEIAILFASLPCMVLVIKRNIIGAAGYFGLYGAYFGTALYELIMSSQEAGLDIVSSSNLIFICIGIILPFLTFIDVLFNKHRLIGKGVKKEDWFYKNGNFEREYDERADRNQYRL